MLRWITSKINADQGNGHKNVGLNPVTKVPKRDTPNEKAIRQFLGNAFDPGRSAQENLLDALQFPDRLPTVESGKNLALDQFVFELHAKESVSLPDNVILTNCMVHCGTVLFSQGELSAAGDRAIAIGRSAQARVFATVSGAMCFADADGAMAYATAPGAKAYATAGGAASFATGYGALAYAHVTGAKACAHEGGTASACAIARGSTVLGRRSEVSAMASIAMTGAEQTTVVEDAAVADISSILPDRTNLAICEKICWLFYPGVEDVWFLDRKNTGLTFHMPRQIDPVSGQRCQTGSSQKWVALQNAPTGNAARHYTLFEKATVDRSLHVTSPRHPTTQTVITPSSVIQNEALDSLLHLALKQHQAERLLSVLREKERSGERWSLADDWHISLPGGLEITIQTNNKHDIVSNQVFDNTTEFVLLDSGQGKFLLSDAINMGYYLKSTLSKKHPLTGTALSNPDIISSRGLHEFFRLHLH